MSKRVRMWGCGAAGVAVVVACVVERAIRGSVSLSPAVLFSFALFVAGVAIGVGAARGLRRNATKPEPSRSADAPESKKVRVEMVECDTRELCAYAVDAVTLLSSRKGVTVECDVCTRCDLLCDQPRLEQVLSSLLTHAIKRTPRRGIVSLWVDEGESGLDFSVHDSAHHDAAHGTAPEELDAIGLWVAGAILDAHGATLAVESRVDGGTTFRFTLPKIVRAEPSAPDASGEFVSPRAPIRAAARYGSC